MRLWTLHPKYLDAKGLVALWRESLLAKHVLEDKTKGYRNHPQLIRFRNCEDPVCAIHSYLEIIYKEALNREYFFDSTKFSVVGQPTIITVTTGQVKYEINHLLQKLMTRDPIRYVELNKKRKFDTHPLFKIIAGDPEPWEIINNLVGSPAKSKLPVESSSQ